jgi:hypothetical protein
MMRAILLLVPACASALTPTSAMARIRLHYSPPAMYLYDPYNPCSSPNAVSAQGPYVGYNPCNDPNAVFVGGTYAGSDPDPNIRAALIREFSRR